MTADHSQTLAPLSAYVEQIAQELSQLHAHQDPHTQQLAELQLAVVQDVLDRVQQLVSPNKM